MLAKYSAPISKDILKRNFPVQLHSLQARQDCDTLGCLAVPVAVRKFWLQVVI
jgi:hypothetical protein